MPGVLIGAGLVAVAWCVLLVLRGHAAADRQAARLWALSVRCFRCAHPLVTHMPPDRPPPADDFCPAPVGCGVPACSCDGYLGEVGSW